MVEVRKGANVPQLVVVWKPKKPTEENKYSRWSLSLPHVKDNPDYIKHIKGYKKGSIQGLLTLKDNSKIIIYGKSHTHVKDILKTWIFTGMFDDKYLDKKDYPLKTSEINAEFEEIEVIPTYAKYFSTGQKNLQPDWALFVDNKK